MSWRYTVLITTFSIYFAAAHTYLHSFPTRRSSDLGPPRSSNVRIDDEPDSADVLTGRVARKLGGIRSEEHTSELQSHHDLVCRLLIEKNTDRRSCSTKNLSSRTYEVRSSSLITTSY